MTPTADVVLPCLEEAGALPWALERIPPGRRAGLASRPCHARRPFRTGAGGPEPGRCPMTALMVVPKETAGMR